MGDEWPWHGNKWGYWGYNCKGRLQGSGTTHSNRQALREHLQWGYLAENQPDSLECLEKHLEELQKAADKAKLKLEQAKEKASLEKDASSSLGKDEKPSGSSKRKHSKERKVLEKTKAKEKKEEEPLEKGELRRSRKAKDGTCEQLREVKEEPESEEEEGWTKVVGAGGKQKKANKAPKKSLEKDKEEKSLEKDKEEGSLEKDKKPSEKDLASSPSVEREGVRLRPAPPKPVVVVDWHETLEIDDRVPEENEEALEKLLEVAEVHIVSYVESTYRQKRVHEDTQDLRCFKQLAGVHTCWGKWGQDSKAEWCEYLKANAIFDNNGQVIRECLKKHILSFAIRTYRQQRKKLKANMVFPTFAAAVDQYLEL